jgi:hypothetical protein
VSDDQERPEKSELDDFLDELAKFMAEIYEDDQRQNRLDDEEDKPA